MRDRAQRDWPHRPHELVVKADSLNIAAALSVAARSGVIDEHPAHETGRNAYEVRAILPANLSSTGQPNECLIDQRGRLKGVTASFPRHVPARQPTQLRLDQRRQLFERALVAVTPRR